MANQNVFTGVTRRHQWNFRPFGGTSGNFVEPSEDLLDDFMSGQARLFLNVTRKMHDLEPLEDGQDDDGAVDFDINDVYALNRATAWLAFHREEKRAFNEETKRLIAMVTQDSPTVDDLRCLPGPEAQRFSVWLMGILNPEPSRSGRQQQS